MKSQTWTDANGVAMRRCIDCRESLPLGKMNFGRRKRDPHGYNIRCNSCEANYLANKKEIEMANGEKTIVRNSCGHEFAYEIKRPGAQEWLKKQPCPRCRRAGGRESEPQPQPQPENKPEPPKAEPQPKPEADHAWVDAVMDKMPTGIYHRILPDLILALGSGVDGVWLQGPPGTAKSTVVRQAAEGLGRKFYSLAAHEFMTETALFGYRDANGNLHRTPLWDAYENGGVFLLDEVDNGNPNLFAALNSALSNGHAVFAGSEFVTRHPDFLAVATANTEGLGPEAGFIGRAGVDLATRDRFVTLRMPIDPALERAVTMTLLGEATVEEMAPAFANTAREHLAARSANREQVSSERLLKVIGRIRSDVEARFRGTVVSPRATFDAAKMVSAGFTLREAVHAKLVGLKQEEVDTLLRSALV